MNFTVIFDQVVTFLDEHKIRYAVVGAVGLSGYGLARATMDLDFAVESKGQVELINHLESLGYETLHSSSGFSNHVHPISKLGRLDFIYLDESTANILFDNAQQLKVLTNRMARVPSAEHLAAMKVLAMKNDPSRSFQEMSDIQYLLGLPGIDKEKIKSYFINHGLQEKFDEIEK